MRWALYAEKNADRSGGHCIKGRAQIGEEDDARSGGRQQVRRALYDEKGADLSEGAERRGRRSGGHHTVRTLHALQ